MKRTAPAGWGPLFDWLLGRKPEGDPDTNLDMISPEIARPAGPTVAPSPSPPKVARSVPPAAGAIATVASEPRTHAEKLAACRAIMNGHGLADWKLRVGHAKRQLGSCVYRSKSLVLSRHLLGGNDWPEVRETILHEIAHALVGPRHGHDRVWKQKARELGVKPRASAPCGAVNMPAPKWEIWCPTCRKAIGQRFRRPPRWRRGYVHDVCRRKVQFRKVITPASAPTHSARQGN